MEKRVTLDEVWELFSKTVLRQRSIKSQIVDAGRYNNYVRPLLGDKALAEISELDLLYLHASLNDAGLSPQTIYHVLSLVRRIMNKAAEWNQYDKRLPSFRDVLPKFDNKRVRWLSPDELKSLLYHLRKIDDEQHWYDATLFAVCTGLRKGEIFALKIEHIDFVNHTAHIVNTKSKKNRVICLNTVAKAIIAKRISAMGDRIRRSNNLFCGANERIFRRAVAESGLNEGVSDNLSKVVFHTLRHTFASWLVQAGFPIPLVSQMLGHSSITVTMKYAHLAPTQEWQAVQAVSNKVRVSVSRREAARYFRTQPFDDRDASGGGVSAASSSRLAEYRFAPRVVCDIESPTPEDMTAMRLAPLFVTPPEESACDDARPVRTVRPGGAVVIRRPAGGKSDASLGRGI